MVVWKNDDELFALMRETLYSSVIGDILDKMNYLHQFLPWRIQPMRENMVVAGRAMTVLEADALETVSEGQNPIMRQRRWMTLRKTKYIYVPDRHPHMPW